jgi:SAM-dependent methyltransferase
MGDQERWIKEQEFFDAEEYSEGPIPPATIERYTLCRKPFLPAECPFWVLGDVRDKRILELGCGDGGNAVLLALKGANVVGIDISPRAIEIAKNRARMHDVEDRVEFHALPLERYLEQAGGKFDIICGFAVLHHLLPVLDGVLADLKRLAGEQTRFVFNEPVSYLRWLRTLRLALPLKAHGTPDERPLEPEDLAILRQRLGPIRMWRFGLLLRVWARFLPGRYEDYNGLRTWLYDHLGRLDAWLLSLPGLRDAASYAVIHAGVAYSGTSCETLARHASVSRKAGKGDS